MQFGLAEIIGSTGVLLATGVGIFQIWLAYAQLRTTKNKPQTNEPTENDKSTQNSLIQRAISQQLQGNLQEAVLLVEKAKAIPIENLDLLRLEQQLRSELKKPYVSEVSGRVIERSLYQTKHKNHHSSGITKKYSEPAGCVSMPAITLTFVLLNVIAFILNITFNKWFSVLVILFFTALLYGLLKWFNF